MHRVISAAALVAGLILLTATPVFAASGAFAYDEATGKYGFSWNEATPQAAEAAAMKGCVASSCKIVFRTGPRECGAIAMTENGKIWGGAKRDRREAAELASIENCQKRTGGQCKVRGAECNR